MCVSPVVCATCSDGIIDVRVRVSLTHFSRPGTDGPAALLAAHRAAHRPVLVFVCWLVDTSAVARRKVRSKGRCPPVIGGRGVPIRGAAGVSGRSGERSPLVFAFVLVCPRRSAPVAVCPRLRFPAAAVACAARMGFLRRSAEVRPLR